MTKHFILYCDGGSRGNPGPAASGIVVKNPNEEVIFAKGYFLGIATNNVAEYTALEYGLRDVLALGVRSVECRLDSELVVKQMNGVYKIRNADLKEIYLRVKVLASKFDVITFVHVRREKNTAADAEVNKALDEELGP